LPTTATQALIVVIKPILFSDVFIQTQIMTHVTNIFAANVALCLTSITKYFSLAILASIDFGHIFFTLLTLDCGIAFMKGSALSAQSSLTPLTCFDTRLANLEWFSAA
jgi:hypothetical protein